MQMRSPLTNTTNVICEEELASQAIIDAYQSSLGDKFSGLVGPYFQNINVVKIYKCLDTGYRFYAPLTLTADSQFYEHLQQDAQGYYTLKLEHQLTETFLNPSDRVLEIGCGSGLFMERLCQLGIQTVGLEFNDLAASRARAQGLTVFREDIATHAAQHPGMYDAVCSFQVLEHVADVRPFLQAAIQVLKPGGKLILGVPNNNPFLFQHDKYHALNLPPHHVGLWNQQALKNLAQVFDLHLETIQVEPLMEQDYGYYLQAQLNHWQHHPGFWARFQRFVLFELKPYRLRYALQKLYLKLAQGRNILAVYVKV